MIGSRVVLLLACAWVVCAMGAGCGESAEERQRKEDFARLEALGYLNLTEQDAALEGAGLRSHLLDRAYQGYTYFSAGHAPVGLLMDMEGRILHEWRALLPSVEYPRHRFWRRMYVYPNGDALAIFEGKGGGILKVDRDSNLLWSLSNDAHHDLEVMEDGRIYVLTREVRMVEDIHPERPIIAEAVTLLDADGSQLDRWSILDAFRGTEWEGELRWREPESGFEGDLFHTNTLEVLDGAHAHRHPAFAEGNFLLSFRHTSGIAILDPVERKIIWNRKGPWDGQHQPTFLPNGNILLLSNNRSTEGPSTVIEYDPVADAIVWQYEGVPGAEPFYTEHAGSVSQLPNGNVLVSLSFQGRAVELTRDKQIVWEYVAPFSKNGKTAMTPEYVRLPPDFPIDWATAPSGSKRAD